MERDVRKSCFSDWWADAEDQVLMQVQHAAPTARNTIQAFVVGVRRRESAHLDEEDKRDLKCFQLTILTLQIRDTAQETRIKKGGSRACQPPWQIQWSGTSQKSCAVVGKSRSGGTDSHHNNALFSSHISTVSLIWRLQPSK